MRRRRSESGFTLLETMIALAILFAALVVLIGRTASNAWLGERAARMGVATDLSRMKMYDVEAKLLKEGFQELDQEDKGDFSDQGWKDYQWKVEIEKVELPSLGNMEGLAQQQGQEGANGGGDGSGSSGGGLADSPLASLMQMGGGDASAAAGASFITSQFELISKVLEGAIRKVTLTVTWEAGGKDEELVTTCYFTDPAAVSKTIFGGGGAAAGDDGNGANPNGNNANTNSRGGNRNISTGRNSRGGRVQ